MVEAVSTAAPKQFTTVQYNTKDGETITATKKMGQLLQLEINQVFVKCQLKISKRIGCKCSTLRKTPAKDTVEISKDAKAPTEVQDKDAKLQQKQK